MCVGPPGNVTLNATFMYVDESANGGSIVFLGIFLAIVSITLISLSILAAWGTVWTEIDSNVKLTIYNVCAGSSFMGILLLPFRSIHSGLGARVLQQPPDKAACYVSLGLQLFAILGHIGSYTIICVLSTTFLIYPFKIHSRNVQRYVSAAVVCVWIGVAVLIALPTYFFIIDLPRVELATTCSWEAYPSVYIYVILYVMVILPYMLDLCSLYVFNFITAKHMNAIASLEVGPNDTTTQTAIQKIKPKYRLKQCKVTLSYIALWTIVPAPLLLQLHLPSTPSSWRFSFLFGIYGACITGLVAYEIRIKHIVTGMRRCWNRIKIKFDIR